MKYINGSETMLIAPTTTADPLSNCQRLNPSMTSSRRGSLGEKGLDFELRCVVADVEKSLTVKSDLHYAILKAFSEAAIEMPYPQREMRSREQRPSNGRGLAAIEHPH